MKMDNTFFKKGDRVMFNNWETPQPGTIKERDLGNNRYVVRLDTDKIVNVKFVFANLELWKVENNNA